MECKQCKEAGHESRTLVKGQFKTGGYFPEFQDSDGVLHKHDENIKTTTYQCTEGHSWQERGKESCACGWPDSGPFSDKKPEEKLAPVPKVAESKVEAAQPGKVVLKPSKPAAKKAEPKRLDEMTSKQVEALENRLEAEELLGEDGEAEA